MQDTNWPLFYLLQDDFRLAEKTLIEKRDATSLTVPLLRLYIRAISYQGRREQAIKTIEDYVKIHQVSKENIDAFLLHDYTLLQKKRNLPLMIKNATQGISDALYRLSLSLVGRYNLLALAYGQISLYADSKNDRAYLMIGEIFTDFDNEEKILQYLKYFKPQHPFYKQAQFRLSNFYYEKENYEKAENILQKLLKRFPKSEEVKIKLANFFRFRSDYDKAERLYSNILDKYDEYKPHQWTLLYYRAIAHERNGNWDAAEKDFLASLELKPNDPFILNYLGYSWVDRGEHLEKALDMIKKAVEQRPNDGFITDSLGWALYRLGYYQDAVTPMEQAAMLEPTDPTITDHLGDVYYRLGRFKEADYMWERALEFEPDEKLKEKIEFKIEYGFDAFLNASKDNNFSIN